MSLDTHPYRIQIAVYSHVHGLAEEPGADISGHGPLGAPYQRWLKRVQTHMDAQNKRARTLGKLIPYPGVKVTGILDKATREALTPDKPSWQEEFVRIARQDAANPNAAYYTQGSARWQGITSIYGKVKPQKTIPYLRSGDCSAGYTRWVLWGLEQSLGRVPHDIVNNASWQAGFTGTIAATCRRIKTPVVGCAALYGRGPTFEHVTGVTDPDNKLCVSHGSNAGPTEERWDYRSDLYGFFLPVIQNA